MITALVYLCLSSVGELSDCESGFKKITNFVVFNLLFHCMKHFNFFKIKYTKCTAVIV